MNMQEANVCLSRLVKTGKAIVRQYKDERICTGELTIPLYDQRMVNVLSAKIQQTEGAEGSEVIVLAQDPATFLVEWFIIVNKEYAERLELEDTLGKNYGGWSIATPHYRNN